MLKRRRDIPFEREQVSDIQDIPFKSKEFHGWFLQPNGLHASTTTSCSPDWTLSEPRLGLEV
jgi:hypothetical protein